MCPGRGETQTRSGARTPRANRHREVLLEKARLGRASAREMLDCPAKQQSKGPARRRRAVVRSDASEERPSWAPRGRTRRRLVTVWSLHSTSSRPVKQTIISRSAVIARTSRVRSSTRAKVQRPASCSDPLLSGAEGPTSRHHHVSLQYVGLVGPRCQFIADTKTASLPAGEGPARFSPSTVKDWQPRRKSVSNACERCRRRKIRCDGDTPCATCKRFSLHCMRTQKPREVVASSVPGPLLRVIAMSRDKHSHLSKGTPSRTRGTNTPTGSATRVSYQHTHARHGVD
jgi:hypothetical protein